MAKRELMLGRWKGGGGRKSVAYRLKSTKSTENYPAVRKRSEKSLRGGVGPGWAGWVPGQLQWEAQERPKLRRDDGASAVSETMSKAQGSRGIVEETRRGV